MSEVRRRETNDRTSDPAEGEARPTVIVAPELKGRRDFAVIREPDDSDADYEARCKLVALLLDVAEKD
jgi:hypothetical protein